MTEEVKKVQDVAGEGEIIKLQTSDNEVFLVPKDVAFMSGTVKTLVSEVESLGADEVVPLRNVTGPILAKVIDFCKHQLPEGTAKTSPDFLKGEDEGDVDADDDEGEFDVDSNKPKDKKLDKMSEFEAEFVNVEQPVLFDIMLAANYLAVQSLLDFLIQHVANMIIACETPEEIREKFKITNDLSQAEVEEIKKRHTWAFE